jgi:hypothetical protein
MCGRERVAGFCMMGCPSRMSLCPDLGGRGSGSSAKGASGGAAPPAEKVKAPEGGAQRCADSALSADTATARPAVTASAATAMLGLCVQPTASVSAHSIAANAHLLSDSLGCSRPPAQWPTAGGTLCKARRQHVQLQTQALGRRTPAWLGSSTCCQI